MNLRSTFLRLKNFLHPTDRDLHAELSSHLQLHIDDFLRQGLSPQEARRQALLKLGGLEQTKQLVHDQQSLPFAESLLQDLRFALRLLKRSPAFTAVAILTLALGIGANTALFSIVNAVLLRPLPYPQSERLVTLRESKPNFATGSISFPNFLDWRKDNTTFSAMAAMRGGRNPVLTGLGDAEQLNAVLLSSRFFELLGVQPILGRTFTQDEEGIGGPPQVLITTGFWKRKFASSPDVLGKTITLDGKGYAIIGVIPSSFDLLGNFRKVDLYIPIGQWGNPLLTNRNAGLGISGIGRLKPGVTMEQARADMKRISENLAAEYPDSNKNISAALVSFRQWNLGGVQTFLFVLLGAVGFVLLIACLNVANLLLARSTRRAHEFAVRAALGAGQGRIVRQLLVESVLISFLGGLAGLFLAAFGTKLVLHALPADALPRAEQIGMDPAVFLFAFLLSLLSGVFFGLVPAFKTARTDPQQSLQEGTRAGSGRRHRLQSGLVAAEISLALVLLLAAGLMIRTLAALHNVNPGFDTHNVLVFGLTLPPNLMEANPDSVRSAFRNVQSRFETAPRVDAVAYTWGALPFNGDDEWVFWIDGRPKPPTVSEENWALNYVVGPGYLRLMGIPLKSGRFFTDRDNERAPRVAVVDEVFAEKYFPGQNPIGQRLHINDAEETAEIVGIVNHVNQWGLDSDSTQELRSQLYIPFMQLDNSNMALSGHGVGVLVRSAHPAAVFDSLRKINRDISNEQVLFSAQTMDEIISLSVADRRFSMILLGLFASLALILSAVGIYGVVSYIVGQSTREIGIRVALGAQYTDILRMILGQGAKMTAIGIVVGIGVSFAVTRLLTSLLFGVSHNDPVTLIGVAALLAAVSLVACFFPARRASQLDPASILRSE
jgi:predicted permease